MKKASIVKSLLAATLLIGGIGHAGAQERSALKLVFSAPPTTFQLPHFVAVKEGFLDKAGLTVTETFVAGDSNAIRALISGNADIATSGLLTALQAIAEGAKIKVIGAWQPKVDYELLVRTNVKTVQDLAGTRIATASAGALTQRMPEMVMQKHGVDKTKNTFIPIGGHEARMKAVVAGKVDASVVGMLYAATAMSVSKDVHVLTSITDDFPLFGFTFLMATDKDLADPVKRQALEKFVRASIIEGSRFVQKNPDRAAETMQGRSPDLSLELTKEVIRQMSAQKLWGVNGGMEPELIDFNVKIGVEMGVLKRVVTPEESVDRSLVDKALKEAGAF
jgi:ABC-type nitrate/sulfonate/bicarbonate transport system substrate-binding protein